MTFASVLFFFYISSLSPSLHAGCMGGGKEGVTERTARPGIKHSTDPDLTICHKAFDLSSSFSRFFSNLPPSSVLQPSALTDLQPCTSVCEVDIWDTSVPCLSESCTSISVFEFKDEAEIHSQPPNQARTDASARTAFTPPGQSDTAHNQAAALPQEPQPLSLFS